MPDDKLFSYSSGRFLYNEELRLRERHVRFDVAALENAIAKHVDHGNVKSITKPSEGGFNRVLLATMEDDFRAIIKIPYWISGPKTYATASEVATLKFLRSKGVPVPEVYGWSSTSENGVGVEYIIMEHASGVGVDTRWFDTTKYQNKALVTGIVDIEKKLFNIPFGSVGSVYFKNDLPREWQGQLYQPGTPDESQDSETYCIGPIADYMFWYGQRAKLDLNRGPCMFSAKTKYGIWAVRLMLFIGSDPRQYLIAIANKEIKWTERFGKPLECGFPHNTVFPGVNSPRDYLDLLKKYLTIAPYLLPKDPRDILNRPILRHPGIFCIMC